MPAKKIRIIAVTAFSLLLVALLWYGLIFRPGQRDAAELSRLAAELAPYIRAEEIDAERSDRISKLAANLAARSRASRELILGAEDFWAGRPREAERHFDAVLSAAPDEPHLLSFKAAANLRLGNSSLSAELFQRAMLLKGRADYSPVDLSYDQLGLALSLFMLGRPAEARPLAEAAWRGRGGQLGPGAPDALLAANRLATIDVALNENERAERLLKETVDLAQAGGSGSRVALEEARLLLAVIYNQSGRRQEPPPAEEAATSAAEEGRAVSGEGSVRAALEAMKPMAATEEELRRWDQMADELAGYNDGLAAELRVRSILGRVELEGIDLKHPGLRSMRLALASAWLKSGRFALAGELLEDLAGEITDQESGEFVELSSLSAESLEGLGRLREAEDQWRAAIKASEACLKAASRAGKPLIYEVNRNLRLHLKLADNIITQGRVVPEAEIELRAALGKLEGTGGIGDLADYPATGRVYLRLAGLVRDMNRADESDRYFRLAQAGAEALLRQNPDDETRRELAAIIDLARNGLKADNAGAAGASEKPAELPPPDLLKRELAALAALGRIDDFSDKLMPALAEAGRRFGVMSRPYMRYYSLKLKWLEDSGRVTELTDELAAQAANPPGRNETERMLNQAGALIYAAKVNENTGRPDVAADLYRQALTRLENRTEPILAARRLVVEKALAELDRPAEDARGD